MLPFNFVSYLFFSEPRRVPFTGRSKSHCAAAQCIIVFVARGLSLPFVDPLRVSFVVLRGPSLHLVGGPSVACMDPLRVTFVTA